tara:strand:- start:196 stop:630 length:435 start_codon:yes stop_codon:yes gene_type:complete
MALTGSFKIPVRTFNPNVSSSQVHIFEPDYPCLELRSTTASSWWIKDQSTVADTTYTEKYVVLSHLDTRRTVSEGGVDQIYQASFNVYADQDARASDFLNYETQFQVDINQTQMDLGASSWAGVYGYVESYSGSEGDFTNLISD